VEVKEAPDWVAQRLRDRPRRRGDRQASGVLRRSDSMVASDDLLSYGAGGTGRDGSTGGRGTSQRAQSGT
jgi:hypothetical protein